MIRKIYFLKDMIIVWSENKEELADKEESTDEESADKEESTDVPTTNATTRS